MRKRRCLVLLGALCFAALCLGMAGCKEEKSNALHGFELTAIADTMEVGNVFTLPDLTVYDDAANTYAVEWSVVNEGAPIELVLGQFIPAKTGIYTVSATVVFEGESKTLSKDIDCVDTSAPVILRENLPENAIVGDEIDLGAVFVCDNSGTAEIGYTVYENGDRENPVSVTEEKTFTVENVGRYEIVITAEDASGNNTEETFFLSARTAPAEWEVEGLEDEGGVASFTTYANAVSVEIPKEYVSGEVGGREGAKLAMEAVNPACGYPALFVDPAYDLAYYTEKGYTHIKASLYIDGATLTTGTSKTAIFFLNGQHQFQENIPADEWVEVQIPIENFFDNVNGEGFAALFNFVNEGAAQDAAMTVYLGGLTLAKA